MTQIKKFQSPSGTLDAYVGTQLPNLKGVVPRSNRPKPTTEELAASMQLNNSQQGQNTAKPAPENQLAKDQMQPAYVDASEYMARVIAEQEKLKELERLRRENYQNSPSRQEFIDSLKTKTPLEELRSVRQQPLKKSSGNWQNVTMPSDLGADSLGIEIPEAVYTERALMKSNNPWVTPGFMRLQKQGGKLTEVWTPFN